MGGGYLGYPGQVRTGVEGTWATPRPGQDRGGGYLGYPQARSGQGVPRVPPGARSGWEGTHDTPPRPGQDGGYLRYPPSQVRMGGYPGTGQHMEYLISGGQYASCIHAGGLSCLVCLFIMPSSGTYLILYLVIKHY